MYSYHVIIITIIILIKPQLTARLFCFHMHAEGYRQVRVQGSVDNIKLKTARLDGENLNTDTCWSGSQSAVFIQNSKARNYKYTSKNMTKLY